MNRPILKLCSLRSIALALVLSACAVVLAACAQNLETGSIPTGVAPQRGEAVAAPLPSPTFAFASMSQPLARKSAAPEKNEVFDVIPVFWGTNRKAVASSAENRLRFAADRSDELQTGVARVTVPLSKRSPGEIHRPWEVGVLSWTLYSQKEDPRRHFTFTGMERMPLDGFLEAASRYGNRKGRFEDHAFVFVHGYNTDFDSALFRTA